MLLKGKSDLPPHQNWLEKANFLWKNEKILKNKKVVFFHC
jgi:hypothetical protein